MENGTNENSNGTKESNPARKRFKNEVVEDHLQDNPETKQKVLQNLRDKNEVSETKGEGRNDNGVQNEGGEKGNSQKTQGQNESGANEEKGEGEKIEKRGRKPMTPEEKEAAKLRREAIARGEKVEPIEKKDASKFKAGADSLDSSTSAYKRVATPSNTTTPAAQNNAANKDYVDLSQYISGMLFLIAIDAIFPSVLLKLIGWFDKKYKYLDKSTLRLTPTEKKELEPLAESVVKILFGHVHPAVAFAVTLAIIYAGKIMNADESDFNLPDNKLPLPNKKTKLGGGRK